MKLPVPACLISQLVPRKVGSLSGVPVCSHTSPSCISSQELSQNRTKVPFNASDPFLGERQQENTFWGLALHANLNILANLNIVSWHDECCLNFWVQRAKFQASEMLATGPLVACNQESARAIEGTPEPITFLRQHCWAICGACGGLPHFHECLFYFLRECLCCVSCEQQLHKRSRSPYGWMISSWNF